MNVLPRRESRTHVGGTAEPPDTRVVDPPVAVRCWNAAPRPGEKSMNAFRALASSPARIMTPAFDH